MANERKAQLLFNELLKGISESISTDYKKQLEVRKDIVGFAVDDILYRNVCVLSSVIINNMLSKGEDLATYIDDGKVIVSKDIEVISPGIIDTISTGISKYVDIQDVDTGSLEKFLEEAILSYAKYFKVDINDVSYKRAEFVYIAKKLELKYDKIERCLSGILEYKDKQKVLVDKLNDEQATVFFNICISTAYICKLVLLSKELGEFFKRFIKVRYGDILIYSVVEANVNAYFGDKTVIDDNLVVKKENTDSGVEDKFGNKSKLTQHIQFQSKIVEEVM